MASIFATPYTLSSYSYPTGVTTTKTALGAVTIPDPGFDWTPIVFAQVGYYAGTDECGALIEARMGTSSSGTLVASGVNGIDSYQPAVQSAVEVAPSYANGIAGAPSFSGAQTITLWVSRWTGGTSGTVNLVSGGIRFVAYTLPTT